MNSATRRRYETEIDADKKGFRVLGVACAMCILEIQPQKFLSSSKNGNSQSLFGCTCRFRVPLPMSL